MTTLNQNKHWNQSYDYLRQASWDEKQSFSELEACFISLKRSKKGMRLNMPDELYGRHISEQSLIGQIPVLPVGGCSDIEYKLYKQNIYEEMFKREQMKNNFGPDYTPSVTINIGAPIYNQTRLYQQCQQKYSTSTVSINPTVITEEPWVTKKNIVPLGLYCCGESVCGHSKSREQKVINLEVPGNNLKDDKFVYVIEPPRISPLKLFWNLLTCKKKAKLGEVYLPTAMTRPETKQVCAICPKYSDHNSVSSGFVRYNHNRGILPREMSTITESLITVSEYSSEEFNPNEYDEKVNKPGKHLHGFKGGRTLNQPSFTSRSQLFTNSFGSHQPVYRWVCEPKKSKILFGRSNKEYICYKDFE